MLRSPEKVPTPTTTATDLLSLAEEGRSWSTEEMGSAGETRGNLEANPHPSCPAGRGTPDLPLAPFWFPPGGGCASGTTGRPPFLRALGNAWAEFLAKQGAAEARAGQGIAELYHMAIKEAQEFSKYLAWAGRRVVQCQA